MENGLSPASLAMLSDSLKKLERDLSDLLTTTESDAQPTPLKENASRLSRMDEMHNQSILRANRIVTKNRLIEVQKAMIRLEEQNYGSCLNCFEDIALPRLKAYPEASLCIDCKSKTETI
ncbi:MAG: TraR/DksA family transcriptional regulator [Pseudomonadales bacterium]